MAIPETRSRPEIGGSFLTTRRPAEAVLVPEAFDDELRMIGQAAQRFVDREVLPVGERLEHLDYELSVDLMRRAGALGLLGIDVPEEDGGLGLSKAASMLVTEGLARGGSFNVTFSAHSGIGTLPLVYFGTPEQRARYLPRLATGEWIAAYCLTEPGSGSDSLAARTKAVRSDDGSEWVLNGTKMWISNAGFADLFTVFAKIDGERFSAFLVERDTPGLSFGAEERKMGIKGSSTRQVILEDARIPVGNLLGEPGRGHEIAFQILNLGRLKLAAGAVGGCKEMVGLAARYALEREQFGVPIASFGLIREKVGVMAARAFALESAVYRLTGALDERLAGATSREERLAAIDEYVVEYSLIKVAGSEILDDAIDETLQIHGGNGYSAEFPIELAYRNSRINRIFEGTNEINRLLTSGQLLKRAMKGRLDLLGPAQEAVQGVPLERVDAPEALAGAALAVENLKRAALLLAGLGAFGFQEGLEHEQEVMARVADTVMDVYLAESALLRAERLQGERRAEAATRFARLVAFEAVDRARIRGREALRRIPRGPEALGRLDAYLPEHGVDLIEERRRAAALAFEAEGYPLRG